MKQFLVVMLVLLLVGCSAEQAPATSEKQEVQSSNYVEPVKSVIVTPATTTKVQTRTNKVYYFVMTVDEDGFDPKVLTVPWSERIKITLTNEDSTEHSFDIPELKLAYTLKAKETVVVDFVPAIKGDFKIDDRFSQNDGNILVGGET